MPLINTLQHFLRRLTNLSGSNRSLFLPRLHAEQLLDLQAFSFLNGSKSFSVVNSLIAGKSIALCQVLDSRMESNNVMSERLKRLQRVDQFLFEERGSTDLHVGWPFVHGKFKDGTLVRCPLLFFPVSLVQTSNEWVLHLREDAGITFNKSFLLAYAYFNQVALEEDLIDFSFEDWDSDSTVFRTQLYQLLKDKIEINFNPELFVDELLPFKEYKKSEFDETQPQGSLKLYSEAVLGIFPQAGSQLLPDYTVLIKEGKHSHLEELFTSKLNIEDSQRLVREENTFTPLAIDEWQEHAVQQLKLGNSLVIQGPPGTGKSQLISNVICDAIATGKKVLLVCQKRVALDVVHERLSQLGLKNFIGLVHDFRNDRKEIYTTIASQIDAIQDFKNQNRSIDTIQVERLFNQLSRTIETLSDALEEYRTALFHDNECGLSAKELYLTSSLKRESINVKQEYAFFDFKVLPTFLSTLKRYVRYAARFEEATYAWKSRNSFAHLSFPDLKAINNCIDDLIEFKHYFEMQSHTVLGVPMTIETAQSISESVGMLDEMRRQFSDDVVYEFFKHMLPERDEETSLLWLDNLRLLCMNCFNDDGVERSLPSDQLSKFQEVLHKRMEARKRSFIRLLQWEWFSEDKFWLKRVMIANNLEYNRKGFETLEARLDNRLNLEHHLTALRSTTWVKDLPVVIDSNIILNWFEHQKRAIRAKLLFNSIRELKNYANPSKISRYEFFQWIDQIKEMIQKISAKRIQWEQHLSVSQIRNLLNDESQAALLNGTLQHDFEDLVAFDAIKNSLSVNEKALLEKSWQSVGEWDLSKLEGLIQNSLRLEWLNHLETKYPVLRLISTQQFVDMEQELMEAVTQKQKLSKQLLLVKARERVYEHIEFNRLNNPITYRDLEHQAIKKKKIWPLRKVISTFHHELFDLLPCWMASPESVSAIFPLEEIFDLVIFDEASQCFAERGIPALARGKQIMVAGDAQQLQPSDLYQTRWDWDADIPDTEVASLLDLAGRYLPSVHLQGHYRSKSNDLIEFSNKHFYKGRLKMLPDFNDLIKDDPAIEVVTVKGIWDQQANHVEAEAVVERVLFLVINQPEKSLAVITFNATQQQLIHDKLEQALTAHKLAWPAHLIVKNIENIQGDERDIVLFSIAYAPDKKGKMNLQFGSLSQAGGENRLNVAITRAREKIMMVTSIAPEMLNVDEVKNEGPRLLRKYLEYAAMVASRQQRIALEDIHQEHSRDWYLSSKLHSEFVRTTSFPFSDMEVTHLDQRKALVLTDDEFYRNALSAKAAHVYQPLLLEKKGWRFIRLFSRNYWLDKNRILLELQKLTNHQKN
jgi:DNA polymerase III delta prime subunit